MASKSFSELRQDIINGDWVVIATGRAKRPNAFAKRKTVWVQPKETCPFEKPQNAGNERAILAFSQPKDKNDWWLQVFANKFPAFSPSKVCPLPRTMGPYTLLEGVGFHEVIVTRDHTRGIGGFTKGEAFLLVKAYHERYLALMNEACVKYVSIFQNSGQEAGATISHPHSQLIAIPVIPGEVNRSLHAAQRYFKKSKHCAHCVLADFERKEKERIVYENDAFLAVCPYTSRTAFEIVISPKSHSANFELMSQEDLKMFADVLRVTFAKLAKGLGNPSYNYFIHTAPTDRTRNYDFYHWHLEIYPKTAVWAGFEIGTGIEISTIRPEDAALFLRKQKVT